VAAGVIGTRPGLAGFLLTAPFRLVNAPFYFLSGTHHLHAFVERIETAFNSYIGTLKDPWVKVKLGDVQITATPEHLQRLREQFTATGSPNFVDAALLQTPNNDMCSVIILNQTATNLVIAVVMFVGTSIMIRIARFILRYIVRYGIKTTKHVKGVISEEISRDNKNKDVGNSGSPNSSTFKF
jgi:hypothetical protein